MISNALKLICVGSSWLIGVVVDERSLIPLGTTSALLVMAFIVGRYLQKILDRLKAIEERVKRHENCCNYKPRNTTFEGGIEEED